MSPHDISENRARAAGYTGPNAMLRENARLRAEIERLRTALTEIASHDTGMRADFSVGAKQAAIARRALGDEA